MFTITGNTYNAKRVIKDAGFEWTGAAWVGNAEAAEELRRISRPTYSRANANAMAACEIVETAPITESAKPAPKCYIAPAAVAYGCKCSVCGETITSRTVDTNYARGTYCGCEG